MKKISVIIPIYNVEPFLGECLDSVLNQTYENLELVLVEDKSTDNSYNIALAYQAKYPNIVLLQNKKNMGLSYTRNRGVKESTGDYVVFVDSDDIIDKTMIEKLMNAIKITGLDIAMCKYKIFIKNIKEVKCSGNLSSESTCNEPFLYSITGHCWNKIYKKSLIEGLDFPVGRIYEDVPFTYPVLVKAQNIAYLDEVLYYYRKSKNSITMTNKFNPSLKSLDIYYSSLALENNYSLVKQNDNLDLFFKYLGHSFLTIMALDSALWYKMPYKLYRENINLFMYLSNNRYEMRLKDNKYINYLADNNFIYSKRLKILKFFVNENYNPHLTELETLQKLESNINEYVYVKCKGKKN